MTETVPLDRIVRAYCRIRDARAELKQTYKKEDRELREQLETLGNSILGLFNNLGIESARTISGTPYRTLEILPQGSDWDAFFTWVSDTDNFDALERRIKRSFIVEYMHEHKGGLPPGVTVHQRYAVRVTNTN